jgi:hypothetical protein
VRSPEGAFGFGTRPSRLPVSERPFRASCYKPKTQGKPWAKFSWPFGPQKPRSTPIARSSGDQCSIGFQPVSGQTTRRLPQCVIKRTCKLYPLMWRPSQIENEESDRAHLQRAGDARHPVRTQPLPTTLTIRPMGGLIKLALMGFQPPEPARTAPRLKGRQFDWSKTRKESNRHPSSSRIDSFIRLPQRHDRR